MEKIHTQGIGTDCGHETVQKTIIIQCVIVSACDHVHQTINKSILM